MFKMEMSLVVLFGCSWQITELTGVSGSKMLKHPDGREEQWYIKSLYQVGEGIRHIEMGPDPPYSREAAPAHSQQV